MAPTGGGGYLTGGDVKKGTCVIDGIAIAQGKLLQEGVIRRVGVSIRTLLRVLSRAGIAGRADGVVSDQFAIDGGVESGPFGGGGPAGRGGDLCVEC